MPQDSRNRVTVELVEKRTMLSQLTERIAEIAAEEKTLDRNFKKVSKWRAQGLCHNASYRTKIIKSDGDMMK